jgi:hypothetical protein
MYLTFIHVRFCQQRIVLMSLKFSFSHLPTVPWFTLLYTVSCCSSCLSVCLWSICSSFLGLLYKVVTNLVAYLFYHGSGDQKSGQGVGPGVTKQDSGGDTVFFSSSYWWLQMFLGLFLCNASLSVFSAFPTVFLSSSLSRKDTCHLDLG